MPLPAALAPLMPAIIGGGSALATGLITSAFNANQAQKNRDFQERMSSTAHQREVKDLRAAGLNPILSANHGGASTPSGATATATMPDVISSAMSAAQSAAQIRDINSAAALKDAQAKDISLTQQNRLSLLKAQMEQALSSSDLSDAQINKVQAEIENINQQLKLLQLDTSHSAYDLDRAKNESEFQRTFMGDIAPWIKFIKSTVK